MNSLFNSNLTIGKNTKSYDSTIQSNGSADYIVGYNPSDFFYVTVDPAIMPTDCFSNVVWNLQDSIQDKTCLDNPESDNDKGVYCYQRELCKNQYYSEKVMSTIDKHSSSIERYLDVATQTNTQVINMVNLSVGVAAMLYVMFNYW